MKEVEVSLEFTPNPNTLKFLVNQVLLEKGALNYTSLEAASNSPLARKLFGVEGITGVMVGHNFITITKGENGDWEKIHQSTVNVITTHLSNDEKVVEGDIASAPTNHTLASGEIETKIRKVLDEEIRPAATEALAGLSAPIPRRAACRGRRRRLGRQRSGNHNRRECKR